MRVRLMLLMLVITTTVTGCATCEIHWQPYLLLELRAGVTATDVADLRTSLMSDQRVESVEYLSPDQTAEEVRSFEDSPTSQAASERIQNAPATLRVYLRLDAPVRDREAVLELAKSSEFATLLANPQDPEFGFGGEIGQ